jgi:hypothetical protein
MQVWRGSVEKSPYSRDGQAVREIKAQSLRGNGIGAGRMEVVEVIGIEVVVVMMVTLLSVMNFILIIL